MKRLIGLIMVLVMLIPAAVTHAEKKHCVIETVVFSEEQEIRSDLNIYLESDGISLTSTLAPDICIRASGPDPEKMLNEIEAFRQNISAPVTAETIRTCIRDWIAFMQPVVRRGAFSGDTFEQANSMQRIVFSYGDLMLLSQRILMTLKQQGIGGEMMEGDWSSLLTPPRNLRFDLKIFDDGKYISLNVLDGTDIVMTVSANLSDPDSILLIIGRGFNGKNYYSRILAEKKENRLDITEALYADDMKTGYPGLGENNLIFTRNATFEWETDQMKVTACLFPANGLVPITLSGTVKNAAEGRFLEGEIHFAGSDRIQAEITAETDGKEMEEMPERVIDLNQADEKTLFALGTEIGVSLLPMLFQVIGSLPEEYINLVMKLMQ